jgi:signal transduction histidine kinase
MAREVERSQATLRDFVADASHELRTPLTAIQGFSQAVEDGVLDAPPDTVEAARLIHREAERMGHLVEDLLLLSKMEARDRAVARDPVDITELVDTITQRFQPLARERGLRLTQELPEGLVAAGDATQLERLFGNLLDNAAKYTPPGGTISVRATLDRHERSPGRAGARLGDPNAARTVTAASDVGHPYVPRIVVSVHNTGSYIPREDLPHVFERFYRVDKSRARDVDGSGLGLAIAREAAERHGGSIRAESDPSSGTTFIVNLPATPETQRPAPSSAGGRGAVRPLTPRRGTVE